MAQLLANKVGTFIELDVEDNGWGRYMGFRVLIDLNMPLRRENDVKTKSVKLLLGLFQV